MGTTTPMSPTTTPLTTASSVVMPTRPLLVGAPLTSVARCPRPELRTSTLTPPLAAREALLLVYALRSVCCVMSMYYCWK